jgi:hypothetical protein
MLYSLVLYTTLFSLINNNDNVHFATLDFYGDAFAVLLENLLYF